MPFLMVEEEICSEEEKRIALNRAIGSRTFARSEQLRSFLRYVCEAELRGGKSDLTEYVIGVEVLHRPAGYSPSEDSSVRTRAYELRQKLEKLYSTELPNEPVKNRAPERCLFSALRALLPGARSPSARTGIPKLHRASCRDTRTLAPLHSFHHSCSDCRCAGSQLRLVARQVRYGSLGFSRS